MIDIEIINNNKDYKSQYLTLEKGTTIQELVNNILNLDIKNYKIGVYGKIQQLSYTLQDKDRVEFYEDIVADPKIKREKRAKNL
jgi:putative ubiquitin-RnfH superfamily antitoxin RatB of RatAB toxin-antitoxin module